MSASRWSAGDLVRFAAKGAAAQKAVNQLLAGSLRASPPRARGKMNKLERDYAQRLELERLAGVWQWWAFEPIKLRLANGAWYKPDFCMIDTADCLVIHETKGHWREAARVRIKVAAELYPFRFVAVTRPKGGDWTFTQY
jgi:hypothetical protein